MICIIRKEQSIDKNTSNVVKALALLLVVFGHNAILLPSQSNMMSYLYCFHIFAFFILPFFYYEQKVNIKEKVKNAFVRCLVPFAIFYTLTFLGAVSIEKIDLNVIAYLMGLFNIHGENAGTLFSATFLWFLPSYMWLILVKLLYYKKKWLFYTLFICSVCMSINLHYTWHYVYEYVPFYIARGLYYMVFAIAAVCGANYLKCYKEIGVVLFILLTVMYWCGHQGYLLKLLMPVSGFYSLLIISKKFCNNKWLIWLGKKSLVIYLTHQYIYQILYVLKPMPLESPLSILYFLFTMIVAGGIAYLFDKYRISRYIFPRNIEDVKNLVVFKK